MIIELSDEIIITDIFLKDIKYQKIKEGIYRVNVEEKHDVVKSIIIKNINLKTKPKWELIDNINIFNEKIGIFCKTIIPTKIEKDFLENFYKKCNAITLQNYTEIQNIYKLEDSIRLNSVDVHLKIYKEELKNCNSYKVVNWYKDLIMLYQHYLITKTIPEKPKLIRYGNFNNKGFVTYSDKNKVSFFGYFIDDDCLAIKLKFI